MTDPTFTTRAEVAHPDLMHFASDPTATLVRDLGIDGAAGQINPPKMES